MKLPKFTKRQLIIAGAILLLLIAIGIYFYLEYKKKKQSAQDSMPREAPVIPLVPDGAYTTFSNSSNYKLFSDCPNDTFPLKYGKCGKKVEQFQMYLIKNFGAKFSQYGVDGKWGEETETMANKFITKNAPFTISEEYFTKTGMGFYTTIKYA